MWPSSELAPPLMRHVVARTERLRCELDALRTELRARRLGRLAPRDGPSAAPRPGADEAARERRFASALAAGERLGWTLGVLSAVRGADVLRERREARGVAWLLAVLDEHLRAEGRPLPAPRREPATVDVARLAGWELPWICANLLAHAQRAAAPLGEPSWSWSFARRGVGYVLACSAPRDARLDAWARRAAAAVDGVRYEPSAPGWRLVAVAPEVAR